MTQLDVISNKQLTEEGQIFLQKLRRAVLLWTRGEADVRSLAGAPSRLGKLREGAVALELDSIAERSSRLRSRLEMLMVAGSPDPESDALPLLDEIADLEAEFANMSFSGDGFELDVSNLIDESFVSIAPSDGEEKEKEEQVQEPEQETPDEEEFEIDEEMMEIFAMEAEDHLKNINENLERLERSPNEREALLEIRRSAHTLKGSAGIIGLKKLSRLAHKVEDLLDHISENEIEGNADIFQLLLAATDCISAVANNDASRDLDHKITSTFADLEKMLASFASGVLPEPEPQPVEEKKAADPVEVAELAAPASADEIVKAPAFQQSTGQSNRSVVRISLDRLDDLVKLVREMVFGRSVFQQRLSELEQQIKELQNSTRRLQRSSGKLETDFAAGTPSGSPRFGMPGSFSAHQPLTGSGNEAGEGEFDTLEFDRYTEFNQLTRELTETTTDAFAITNELNLIRSSFESVYDSQKRLIDEIQEKLLSLRMIRFSSMSARLQRTVRMTAGELDKMVELTLDGENMEVDTHILDTLVEPLLHLLRNAVAHGIERPDTRRLLGKNEKGHIHLKVFSEGTHIILTVTDDGAGISSEVLKQKAVAAKLITREKAETMTEEEALALVFLPGLTTADKISQISGRGVGMNIVKTNIMRHQGSISVTSEYQRGTTFTIRVPMALAIARALLVRANERLFAIPLKLVKQISEVSTEDLQTVRETGSVSLGSGKHAVSYLNDLLGFPENPKAFGHGTQLLLLDTVKRKCALVVDEIVKPEEVVIKPLGHPLKELHELLGATILGDGTVVPVLDLVQMLENRRPKAREKAMPIQEVTKQAPAAELTVMIVDDSPSVRLVNSRLVKSNGWAPLLAKDGTEALEILTAADQLPDIVLTDVEMPGMDGYELLGMIKKNEKLKHLPVVMITSRAGEKHRLKAMELGVSEYLSKPYEDSKLIEVIRRLTGRN